MKFANGLKFMATGTSAAAITVGAPVSGCRTLAQVIADSTYDPKGIRVGDLYVPFTVRDTQGNTQTSLYTITSATQIDLIAILSSSNGGNAVTFSGPLTVYNSDVAWAFNHGLTDPHDPGFDIVLLLGQSNMVGMDVPISALDVVDARIFTYGCFANEASTYRKITQAVDPLRHNYNPANYPSMPTVGNGSGLGPGSWLARTYAGMIPSNRKVLLVPCARSATKLFADTREWFPGDGTIGSGVALGATGSTLLDNAIDQATRAVAAAQALYPKSRLVGVAWHQGEGDADWYGLNLQLNYTGALKTLIQAIRTRVPTAANAWFVIGGLMGENVADTSGHPGYIAVDTAQRTVAAEFPRCAYTPGLTGYNMGDNLHYSAAGQRVLGCNMASVIPLAMLSPGVDTTAPVTRAAIVYAADAYTVAWSVSEPVDPNFVPATSAFTIAGHTVSSVRVQGNYIYVTCSNAFVNGEAARTLVYTAPGVNGLRDLYGNQMANASQSIGNNVPAVDSTPPAYTTNSATIAAGTPADITFSVGEALANSIPGTSAFTVTENGTSKPLSTILVSGTTVTVRATTSFSNGTTVQMSYTQPGSNPRLQDAAGNATINFGPVAVTNNVPASDTIAPTVSGTPTIANAAPTDIVITMSEALANSIPGTSAFTVTEGGSAKALSTILVSGTTVTVRATAAFSNGTAVQVSYTQPGSNPRLQDAAGNATINFGPLTVTNNVAAAGGTGDIRFDSLVNMNETSAVVPYSYAVVNYAAISTTVEGGVSMLGMAGDGTFTVKINYTSSTRNMVGFRTTRTVGAYNTNQFNIQAGTNYGIFIGTGNLTVTRAPVDGDLIKLERTGTTVQVYISSDNGTSYQQIAQLTGVATGTLYVQIMGQTGATFTAPQGTGFA
jgi:hypothetical protein